MKKSLTRIAIIGLGIAAGLPALALDTEENRDVDAFDAVVVGGFVNIDITVGRSQSVRIETEDDEHLEHIITEVEDGVLTVRHNRRHRNGWNGEVNLRISVPSLRAMEVNGTAHLDVRGIESDDFEAVVSSTGTASIEGTCKTLNMDVRNTGTMNGENFECEDVDLSVKQSGSVSIFASEAVEASSSGSGSVRVYGGPEQRHTSADRRHVIRFARK